MLPSGSAEQKQATKNVPHRYSPQVRDIIKEFILTHKDYPYATKSEKKILAERTGLTESQITMYLSNWRRRNLTHQQKMPFKRSLYYY